MIGDKNLILEVAVLNIIDNMNDEFESAFKQASEIISSMNGYHKHELRHCIERENQYILLVWWKKLEDHTVGFRKSAKYQKWKELLHKFYDPFPDVLHYSASLI